MDIAVAFEKINIDDYYCIFKPQGIIRGLFDSKSRTFESEFGLVFDMMQDGLVDGENYFAFPTTFSEIKKRLGDDVAEDALLSEYLNICTDNCYIGYYDSQDLIIKVKQIPFELIEKSNLSDFYSQDETLITFSFSTQYIEELINSNSLDEVKEKLGAIVDLAHRIEKNREKIETEPNEEEKKSKKLSLKKDESKCFNLAKLRKHVKKSIIGQDEAVDDITRTIAINITSENPRNKSHMLIMGPSGTGKTEIMKNIVQYLNIPFFQADATAYTKAGYVGKDVNSILLGLLRAANNDLELAQKGLIIIDEIDKKALNANDDVSGKAVLHSLLKILDREVIEVDTDYHNSVLFDTSNLTVALVGSFQELYEAKTKFNNKPIGFTSTLDTNKPKFTLTDEELIKYLGPELFGRIGMKTSTNHLSLKDCIDILTKSDIGQISIAKSDFESRGIKFSCTHDYLVEIAKQGYSQETGARNLNKVARENLRYAYDEIFTRKKVKQLKFTKATAHDPRKFYVE